MTTRRWKDNQTLIESVGLILIDEVHLLNDTRGACLEGLASRCKIIKRYKASKGKDCPAARMRFFALRYVEFPLKKEKDQNSQRL